MVSKDFFDVKTWYVQNEDVLKSKTVKTVDVGAASFAPQQIPAPVKKNGLLDQFRMKKDKPARGLFSKK